LKKEGKNHEYIQLRHHEEPDAGRISEI
jgi:hypothetical protein